MAGESILHCLLASFIIFAVICFRSCVYMCTFFQHHNKSINNKVISFGFFDYTAGNKSNYIRKPRSQGPNLLFHQFSYDKVKFNLQMK